MHTYIFVYKYAAPADGQHHRAQQLMVLKTAMPYLKKPNSCVAHKLVMNESCHTHGCDV